MSYDLDIYFPHQEFPVAEFEAVLSLLGLPVHSAGALEWSIWAGTWVFLDVSDGDPLPGCAPDGVRWRVTVSTSLGRTRTAWAAQWAVPYGALCLIEGTRVHDCQMHELGVFSTLEAWEGVARRQCPNVDLPFAANPELWLRHASRDGIRNA
jgi:hypothetical protein